LVVLDATDYASYSNIASAIMYAADHGVRIISISIAGSSPSSALQSAVDYAWNKGAIVIAAAGNSATSIPYYPAACDKVIAVSATDGNDALASFSNYGTWIDIAAPGTMIYTTTNGGGYGYWQGTSFSAPIVSSVASLILSIRPTITNSVLVNTLLNSADDIGTAGYDSSFGWGRVNAYKAAVAANGIAGADATPPSVTISNPPSGSILSGGVSIQGTASDNIGVSKIELYVDGLLSGTVTASPYSFFWNSGAVPNGSHSLMVKAYDAAGNNASASVSISTSNVLVHTAAPPPTVTITSPTSGSKVVGKTTVGVSASSSIGVAQVSIYVDNVLMYTAAAGPYSYDWNAGKAGKSSHVITATAWDLNGSMSSTSVTVK
ncbi:MAG TPA: Ig-like domain-containing protein, partial [Bryobacteraceae bacterium]|nr:Ig-like domain-containing protein [Bryobacteraceae bacterium]